MSPSISPFSPPISTEMHAWTHTARGPPSRVLHLTSNAPVPRPKKSTDILIKITHAALNPGGAIMLHFCPFIFRHSPAIPEMDFAGVVVELSPASETDSLVGGSGGERSGKFKVGDRVFGSIDVPEHIGGGKGALAEYVVADARFCCEVPEGAKMEEVAGLGIAGTTALALVDRARGLGVLKEGSRVLVNGASGGIGSLVVQLVKGIVGDEGKVVGVCSGRNGELVVGLGANEVVDYTAHGSVGAHLGQQYCDAKFNVVIDALGIQEIWDHSASYLKEDGAFVTVGVANKDFTFSSMFQILWLMMLKNPFLPVMLGGVPRRYERITAFVNEETMTELERVAKEGLFKGVVDSIYEMEDVKKAYEVLLRKKARGKLIIKISEGAIHPDLCFI